LGTLLLASFANFRRKSWLMLGTNLLSGVFPVLFAVSTLPYASLLLMAAVGGATVSFMTLNTTHIQAIVIDTMRGRVMSAYLMSAAGLMSVGAVVLGGVAEGIGAPATMALFAGAWIVLGTIAVLWRQDVWQIDGRAKAFPQEKFGEAAS
jgi:hypothetical protein